VIASADPIGRQVIVAAVLVVAAAAIGLAVATIVGRLVRLRRERAEVARLDRVRPLVIRVAGGDDAEAEDALLAFGRRDRETAQLAVVNMLAKVRGGAADELVGLLEQMSAVSAAVDDLTSGAAIRRARAARLLGLTRDPQHAPRLVALLADRDETVRIVALGAIEMLGDPSSAREVLAAASARRTALPAMEVAETLLAMGTTIGPALIDGLADADPAVRHVAAVVAGHGLFHSAADPLRRLLADDPTLVVRAASATALGRIGDERDVAALAAATAADQPRLLRHAATGALGEQGRLQALAPLADLLDDGDRRLAEIAASSLERLGPAGVAILERSAERRDGPSPAAWTLARRELVRHRAPPVPRTAP
jgi:HEAT repeat protein